MNKLFIPISVGLFCASFTRIPEMLTGGSPEAGSSILQPVLNDFRSEAADAVSVLYHQIGLGENGLSEEAFDYAWKGYGALLEKKLISRTEYLTICDFSQSSSRKRLYVIDVENKKLVTQTWVAHGKNSGSEFATRFSDTPESWQSSLGFYITAGTYTGKHGLSLRIRGVDPGYNDHAWERSIVIHGAAYVDGARARAGIFMGRSWGCPAVPQQEAKAIITTIKNGTCFFIFHPSRNYLLGSKILNG